MVAVMSDRAARRRRRSKLLPACLMAAVALTWPAWTPSFTLSGLAVPSGENGGRTVLTLEDAVAAFKSAGKEFSGVADEALKPLWLSLRRAEASALAPLGRGLMKASVPGPKSTEAALRSACAKLDISALARCPRLFLVVEERRAEIQTLPLDALGRDYGIFLSAALVDIATGPELDALVVREVALLATYRFVLPAAWTVTRALQGKPSKAKRGKAPSPIERAKVARGRIESQLKAAWEQFVQLCRAHRGVQALDDLADSLPKELEGAWRSVSEQYRQHVPPLLSDAAEVIGVGHERGTAPALFSTAVKIRQFSDKHQLGTLMRIAKLSGEVMPGAGVSMSRVRWVYKVGPTRVETMLSVLAWLKHPSKWFAASKKKSKKPIQLPEWARTSTMLAAQAPWRSVKLALSAVRRASELSADQQAASVLGDIVPVASALVLLHGSDEERRRLARGELGGLLEDAQIEVEKTQWNAWWQSAVEASSVPALRLRLTELTKWAETPEGRAQLKTTASSSGSLSTPRPRRGFFAWMRRVFDWLLSWLLYPFKCIAGSFSKAASSSSAPKSAAPSTAFL